MAHNVRSLSARLAEMHSELAVAKSDRRSSKTTKLEIEAAKRGTIVVSDHALLRYIERVIGVDLEKIKQTILSDSIKAQAMALGNGKFPHADGFKVVVQNGVVVTVMD